MRSPVSPNGQGEKLTRHAELQALLLDLAQSMLMSPQDKEDLACLVFSKISEPLEADICLNYRIDPESGALLQVAGLGIPESFQAAARRLASGEAFCGTVAQTRQPFYADALRILQDDKGAFLRAMGGQAYSCHPLFARDGRIIGTFSMASTRRSSFLPEEIDFFRILCYMLSLAWERGDNERRIQDINADLERRIEERTAELRKTNAALVRSNTELENFAHAVAHDLQTPLRSIVGFAQLLQQELRGRLDKRVEEWMNYVVDNTKRLHNLIRDLLSYARLGAKASSFELVDMEQVFGQVVTFLQAPITETGAQISCSDLPTVRADRTQMALLLQNLIENGLKYNREATPRIIVSAERRPDEWVISVADNGIGVDPKHRERIFDIFRRLHTYDDIPGSGIGLAACRRIVERHGGRIWVEAGADRGSVFRFSLPHETADEALQP